MSSARTTTPAASAPPAHANRAIDAGAASLMVLLCAVWGIGQVSIKFGATGISPLWLAGLRSIGATLLVGLWMLSRGIALRSPPELNRWGLMLGAAFGLEFICLYPGMALTTAARGTLLIYTAPFFVAIGAHLMLGDRLNTRRTAGLVLAFTGVGVALADRSGPAAGDLLGDLLCLAAGLFWAATTLLIKATPMRSEQPERTLLWQLAVSGPMLLAASLAFGEAGVFAPTPLIWGALAYQTLIVASASYLGWFVLIQRYSASTLSAFTFLTPLFGVGFATLLLDEALTLSLGIAAVLIAAGIWLVSRR